MATLYDSATLSIPFMEGWESVGRLNSVALYRRSGGKGALNISSAEVPENKDETSDDLLSLFSRQTALRVPLEPWEPHMNVAFGSCVRGGRLWLYWVLTRGRNAVFVSYNSSSLDQNEPEVKEATEIVRSIKMK